jgi:hypothetical protein
MKTRLDLIFSYWIFLWYLLYICKIVNYNPTFALFCGLFENAILLSLMLYYNTHKKLLLLFFIMTIFLKLIPLYTLVFYKNQTLSINRMVTSKDIFATFVLFFIYVFWVTIHQKSPSDFQQQTIDLIIHNKNTLPGMTLLDKIIQKLNI